MEEQNVVKDIKVNVKAIKAKSANKKQLQYIAFLTAL